MNIMRLLKKDSRVVGQALNRAGTGQGARPTKNNDLSRDTSQDPEFGEFVRYRRQGSQPCKNSFFNNPIMKNIFPKLKPQYGITLVEILIALFITTVITAAAMEVYLTQHKSYLWQEQISEMNQNAQFAMDELTKRISYLGYGIPDGPLFDNTAGTSDTIYQPIIVSNNADTVTIISKSPIKGVYGILAIWGIAAQTSPADCYGATDSAGISTDSYRPMDLDSGDYAVHGTPYSTGGISEIFRVLSIGEGDGYTNRIVRDGNWRWFGGGGNTMNTYITKIEFYKYYLKGDSLMLETKSDPDTVAIAPNVDSLNFTYTYHLSNGDTTLNTILTYVSPKMINVRITVRTARMKKDVYAKSNMQLCPDSLSADSMGCAGYGYKNLSASIKIKNKGISTYQQTAW